MDPFVVIVLGGVGGVLVALLLLGWASPGNGADIGDRRAARVPASSAQSEADDLEQMLEAANRRRRRRGEAELTEASVSRSVAQDVRESQIPREKQGPDELPGADEEIEQLLEVKNRRRAAKGLAPISVEQYRRALESGT